MAFREPDCGCTSSAVAALLALVGYLRYLALKPAAQLAPSGIRARVLVGLGVTLGAAVVGKLGGILYHALRKRMAAHRAIDRSSA